MKKAVGIDLGTTNSVIAVIEGGSPEVIANAEGGRTTPSVVAFSKDGERLVGSLAKRQATLNPDGTLFSVKRFVGRKYNEVESELKIVPYRVTEGPNGAVRFSVGGKEYAPEEISASVLRKLVSDASAYLGEKITDVVVTVPAYFNDAQRQATKDAGTIAGLNVLRVVNEPTAAALAYGLDKKKEQKIMVFDLGGGTFDVSILDIGDGVVEVLSTSGDTHLGGDDFDKVVVDWIADEFRKENGIDLRKDKQALQRLYEAAEKAKCELSSRAGTEISLPFITADANGPKHLNMSITRAKFDQLTAHLVERCTGPVKDALAAARLSEGDIDEVVLVGGSTRIPAVQDLVRKLTGGKQPNMSVNPDEVVAVGAAVQAGIISGELDHQKDILITDVCPYTLGISILGEIGGMMMPDVMSVIIKRNTTIPTEQTQRYCTVVDNQKSVEIEVYQGDYKQASQNTNLGTFVLSDLPKAPAGDEKVDVTFAYDINGLLQVTATIASTGKNASITIDPKKTDQLISEQNLEHWQDAPGARRYRRLVQKAEKLLEADEAGYLAFELDRLIKDLKSGLISGQDQEKLEKLRKELNDLVYELEMNQNADE